MFLMNYLKLMISDNLKNLTDDKLLINILQKLKCRILFLKNAIKLLEHHNVILFKFPLQISVIKY